MMKIILIFIFLCIVLASITGCSSYYIHESGRAQVCQSVGLGIIGITVATISHNMCKLSAKKLGYHEFDIDSGYTGIFLLNEYIDGLGINVKNVIYNSPAMCSGINMGQYIYMVGDAEVKNYEDAYERLDNACDDKVTIVVTDEKGRKSKLIIDKMKPNNPYQCNNQIRAQ